MGLLKRLIGNAVRERHRQRNFKRSRESDREDRCPCSQEVGQQIRSKDNEIRYAIEKK